MKYFIDTEFLEGNQSQRVLGFNVGQTKPTIDLISIGIVAEDGREYYAISKEFNLKEAWNRFELKPDIDNGGMKKVYWLRENVLKLIYEELHRKEMGVYYKMQEANVIPQIPIIGFTYYNLKKLIKKYGKTNAQIAEEVKKFVYKGADCSANVELWGKDVPLEFYGYYADYDWVVFCWLFGKMIDLPQGFSMYCNDLKQMMDENVSKLKTYQISKIVFPDGEFCFTNDGDGNLSLQLDRIKSSPNYPKQTNEHNALADARWNKELYEFLNIL